jgi:lipopolysaccharide export system ATP-binding protein
MSVLQVNQLVKSFGRRRVVDGVSLTVHSGEVVGLLGPNGAGKTTTFRMICGLLRPESGSVSLSGTDVTDWPMYERARSGGMGYLPQQSSVFAKLSVRQNLVAMMQLLKMDRATQKRRSEELLEQFKITRLARSRAGSLSGGERRRLEIARCLVSDPEIIMLDEPFAGIDPVTVQGIQEVIRDLANTGISILITDHAAREILQLTDRTYVVSDGKILCSGTTAEIIRHEEVKRKYLGEIDVAMVGHMATRSASAPRQRPIDASGGGETGDAGATIAAADRTPSGLDEQPVWQPPVSRPDKPQLRVRRPTLPGPSLTEEKIVAPFRASDLE